MEYIGILYGSYPCCLCLLVFIFSVNAEYFNATTLFEDYLNSGFSILQKHARGEIDNAHGDNKKYRFISFDTRNDNIEVGFEFSVPFLSIPVQRSLQTVQNLANSAMTGARTNVNIGALALTGVMVTTGVATAYFWRTLYGVRSPTLIGYRTMDTPTRSTKEKDIWHLIETIELTLQKYGIDATACTQRTICSYVKQSSNNVSRGLGASYEKIIDGITSTSWLLRMMSGSAAEDAIRAGRFAYDCEKKYSGCKLKFSKFEDIFGKILGALTAP